MKRTTPFLATLIGGLAMWLLAGLWHLVLVPGFYRTGADASHHEGGVLILAGYVLLALVMAGVYARRLSDESFSMGQALGEGVKLGLVTGLLWVTPHALVRTGAHGGSLAYLAVNGLWHLVEQGIGGAAMGLVFAMNHYGIEEEADATSRSALSS